MLSKKHYLIAKLALPTLAKHKTYQPVYLNGRIICTGRREACFTRWQAIEPLIDGLQVRSVLDLGCAEGFFVRKAVEKHCTATGVDANARRLLWASSTMCLDNLDGFTFSKMLLTKETLATLAPADMVLNLSLTHHIMYKNSRDYAIEFVRTVAKLAKKVMIFEMGQSNEPAFDWSKRLPDMGADPHLWIRRFLEECGFARIETICKARSNKGDGIRVTFAAYV